MLTLATPLRGRALPCHFVTYCSATIRFSYLGFLLKMDTEQIKYVIRLNQGSQPPKFYYDARGKRELKLKLEPEEGLRIYKLPTKIEVGFRDLKSLLHLHQIMNKYHCLVGW
jgi:hypothetical protein